VSITVIVIVSCHSWSFLRQILRPQTPLFFFNIKLSIHTKLQCHLWPMWFIMYRTRVAINNYLCNQCLSPLMSDSVQNVQTLFRIFSNVQNLFSTCSVMFRIFSIVKTLFRLSSTNTGLFRLSWLCSDRGDHFFWWRNPLVLPLTTTYAISAYHHWCCEFVSRSGRDVQHYVIKFVSELWQVGGFPRVPPPKKMIATITTKSRKSEQTSFCTR
jgi:hypothetical protein